MKQKLLYILMTIAALTWSGEGKAVTIEWVNSWNSSPSKGESFYIYHPSSDRFIRAGQGGGTGTMTTTNTASLWNYDNSNRLKSGNYYIQFSISASQLFGSDDVNAVTNQTRTSGATNYLSNTFNYRAGYFQMTHRVSGVQSYYLTVGSGALHCKYLIAGSSNDYYEWYLINQTQYNNHIALESYDPVNTNGEDKIKSFSTSNLPDTYYNSCVADLNPTTKYLTDYKSWISTTNKVTEINSATARINVWLNNIDAMSTAYVSAIDYYNTAVSLNTANIPSGVASSEINSAKAELEASTTTTAITTAENKFKAIIAKFDAISFDESLSANIEWDASVANNWASATSGKTVTYTTSNPDIISVSGNILTALSAGEVTITAATVTTSDKYECRTTRTFKVIPRFYFSSTANVGSSGGGTATASVPASVEGAPGASSGNATATFTATPAEGYKFLGWGTTSDATTYESTEATYNKTLTNSVPGFTVSTTLYAIFAPKTLTLDPASPSIEEDFYKTVTLNRTFSRAGYYSISLPFSTSVSALTGRTSAEDWVAQLQTVTYNAEDGYTLYFNKVTSGEMTANEPYVLHLGAALAGNATWTDQDVEAGEAITKTAETGYGSSVGASGTYADWQMISNFEAGVSMSGKYGIVNSAGALQRGGSTATLNAFTAYITPPAGAAGIKVRTAFTDEFGTTTYIIGLPDEATGSDDGNLYDLSGRKVSEHTAPAPGIYLNQGRRILIR